MKKNNTIDGGKRNAKQKQGGQPGNEGKWILKPREKRKVMNDGQWPRQIDME